VRRINPNADYGIFQGQQIIQAGLFSNRSAAELRSRQLADEGITSGIAAVVVASEGTSASEGEAAYYVIIPGSTRELDDLAATVRTFVDAGTPVTQRDRPLGPHIAIGPFSQRNTAERLSDRLRDEGLRQTRVYYDP
jgi:cell division protein FtsN